MSLTLTACSSLLAVVTIPALARVFGAALGHPLGFAVPLPLIFAQLLLMLALPVALGMWARFSRPAPPAFHSLTSGLSALPESRGDPVIVASDPAMFVHGLRDTVPLAATFVAVSFLAGWLSGTVSGGSPSDVFTLATEFATRNMAVATAIAVTLAGRIEFAVFATTYFLTEIPLMLCAIVVYRRWRQTL